MSPPIATLREDGNQTFFKSVLGQIVATFVVSCVGGGLGISIGYQILVTRVDHLETQLTTHDSRLVKLEDRYTDISNSLQYIRGRLEPKP